MRIKDYTARLFSIDPLKRQAFISLTSTIILTLIGYISTVYFAHALGPSILGAYFLFLAYVGIFNLIGDGGFGGAAVKRISEGSDQDQYFSAFIVLRFILLFLSLGVLVLINPFIVDLTTSGLYSWFILALILGTFSSIAMNCVYGTGKIGIAQISGLVDTIARIIFQIIATFLGYLAGGLALGYIVGIIAGIAVNFRFITLHLIRFSFSHLKSLFSFSFWIFLASSGSLVFSYADSVFIGYFLTNADVGIYRIAFQLTGIAGFITGSLHYVLYPSMSRWYKQGDIPRTESALSKAFTYSLLLAVPVLVGGLITGDKLLYFFYGASFEAGASAFYILLIVQIANVFMYLQTMSLNAIDDPQKSFYSTAFSAALNIVLDIILIPFLGIVGASLATLIAITLNSVMAYVYLSRKIKVRTERHPTACIIIASAVMAIPVLLIRFITGLGTVYSVFLAVLVGGGLYFIVLFKLDRGLKEEIFSLLSSLGISWPLSMLA